MSKGLLKSSQILALQQVIQEVHATSFLLEVGTAIDIEGKGHILMSEDFRKRFDVEFGDFHRSDSKCMSDFVEAYLRQTVLLQESCEELPIGARLCGLALPREEKMVGIVRNELAERDGQHRRKRDRALRGGRLGRADVQTGLSAFRVVDALDGLANG